MAFEVVHLFSSLLFFACPVLLTLLVELLRLNGQIRAQDIIHVYCNGDNVHLAISSGTIVKPLKRKVLRFALRVEKLNSVFVIV